MTDEFESKKKLASYIARELSILLPWQIVMPPYAVKSDVNDEDFEDGGGDRQSPPWLESEGGIPEFPVDRKAENERRNELFGDEDTSVRNISESISNTHKKRAEHKLKKELKNRNKPKISPKPIAVPRPGGGISIGTNDDED